MQKTFEKKPFGSSKTDFRTAFVSMFIAILIHILILEFAPRSFSLMANETDADGDFDMEFEPPEIESVIPQFIEANPAANDDAPKDTPFESFKNQTAAQEKAEEADNSNLPKTDGENDDSNKIVSGNLQNEVLSQSPESVFETLERPLVNPSQQSQTNPKDFSEQTPPAAQNENTPPEIFDDKDTLPASNIAEETTPQETPQNAPLQEEEPLPMPKPRPHLSLQTAAGPLRKNNLNANAVGLTAVDSRFSEFGAYEQRMTEAVARQWYLLASMQNLSSEAGTQVVVEFFLNTSGEITSIKILFNSSTTTGKTLCEQAILSTAPYGKWTPEMIAVLGSQDQSVKFTFYYR